MRLIIITLLIIVVSTVTACSTKSSDTFDTPSEGRTTYMRITHVEAKEMMDQGDNYILLDVRTLQEFQEGHIPGAYLIPVDQIELRADKELTNKSMPILVYCRSGNRSKTASKKLFDLGYTQVYEFGGIIDWNYDITK